MGKFDGMLICTDLDGTLLEKNKSISEENHNAIEYFKSEGGIFTFITGRMPCISKDTYNAINPNGPFGCINGGGIYDHRQMKYLWNTHMPDSVLDVIDYLLSYMPKLGVQVNTFDEIIFANDSEVMKWFRVVTGCPDLFMHHRDINKPIAKVVFGVEKQEEIDEIEKLLKAHPIAKDYYFVNSEKNLCEILPQGVCKGTVIPRLADILGIDMKKTVAVGDYYNDVSMIKAAGVGIAVANAVDEAKAVADYITVSNEESAIAHIIYDIESGNIKFIK